MELIPMWDAQSKDPLYWEFYAIQHKTNCIEEIERLMKDAATQKHAFQLIKTINDTCFNQSGPKLYENNKNICHEAVNGEGIYEIRKGNIRLYWFYGHNRRVVICPMAIVKRAQKTPSDVAKKLKTLKADYFEAANKNNLTYRKQEN